jgi:predicted amidohydrolase YtcJ
MYLRISSSLVALAASIVTTVALAQSDSAPSLIVINARVFTAVPATPWAEAISIVGERIGVVGTTAEVRRLAGPKTRVIDANGHLVIPGFNDAHVHVGAIPPVVRLEGPSAMEQDPTLDQVLARLKTAAAQAPKGGWIYGRLARPSWTIRRQPGQRWTVSRPDTWSFSRRGQATARCSTPRPCTV